MNKDEFKTVKSHDEDNYNPDQPRTREEWVEVGRFWVIVGIMSVVTMASWILFAIMFGKVAFTALAVIAVCCFRWERLLK